MSEPAQLKPRSRDRSLQSRELQDRSYETVVRLMEERGLREDEIQRGIEYAAAAGARKTRDAYVLAMSRVLFTDSELASGKRFTSG